MRQSVVDYKDDDYHVKITVVQCSLQQSFRRNALHAVNKAKLEAREKQGEAIAFSEKYIALRTHPELVAAAKEVQNLEDAKVQLPAEPTMEEFLQLPEALILVWERATYQANPQWVPQPPPEEKKGEKEEAPGEAKEPDNS